MRARTAWLLACFAPAFACAALPSKVAQVLAAEHLPPAAESFVILDPENGHIVDSALADTPRAPASTIKTLTTFAALDMLGPAFLWHTQAYLDGTLADGALDGNLVLKGGGDPYMTLERWWAFVQMLRAKGLKSIKGDIIIDDAAFALPPEDPGAFDGKPNRPYNVIPDALMVNFQSIDFRLAANAAAHEVEIDATPAPPNLIIENRVRFVPGRCRLGSGRVDFKVASQNWDRVVFSGALSPSCAERSFTRVLLTPASYAFGTFVELWRQQGGAFTGRLKISNTPAQATLFASFDSLSLGEIIRLTNKFSSNLMARHLLLTLGEERFGVPATLDKGAQVIDEWGKERGFDFNGIDIDNGSGLSRATHITVLQLARVLGAGFRSPFAPEFMASLPLAGLDGTLRSRMKSVAAGSVRLKTGHIDGVSGVAGYVTGNSGKTYVLVSLVNHPRADYGAGEPVHAALVSFIQENL